jgi:hypothetical protein
LEPFFGAAAAGNVIEWAGHFDTIAVSLDECYVSHIKYRFSLPLQREW